MTEQKRKRKRSKKAYYEKTCEVCGVHFIAEHGNKRICPECVSVLYGNKGRSLPRQYETPENLEQYEASVRKRYMSRYKDTIVAIGYADRQREQTLAMVGKVRTEL